MVFTRVLLGAWLACVWFAPAESQEADAMPAHDWLAPKALASFYQTTEGMLAWKKDSQFNALLKTIQGLHEHGLTPQHYHLEELKRLADDPNARDRLATDAWLSAAAHMIQGKLDPLRLEPDWTVQGRNLDLVEALISALRKNVIQNSLAQFAPAHPGYRVLRQELKRLREKQENAFEKIAPGPALKSGMRNDRVKLMQLRLSALGYLMAPFEDGLMDEATTDALELFQETEGIDADGIAGAATLAALNRDQTDRIKQLRVNMERWRWLPDDLGLRHVRVNIAGFDVTTYANGDPLRTHLAVTGRSYRKTPVFSDMIEYIVFNPWWETPASLARTDKLPVFQKDPASVKRLGFQVLNQNGQVVDSDQIDWKSLSAGAFPYRLRQAPGAQNALGQLKIMFPNKHNVYIHDTPTRDLFSRRQRAFSSGCIRVQDPIDLAAWLLEDVKDWDRERLDLMIATGKETRIDLATKIPVHVLYFTAIREEDDLVRYLDDVYSRDQAVLVGLDLAPV